MVDPVNRISRTDASSGTDMGHTLAIGSDSYNAQIAARQAQINHDLTELQNAALEELARRREEDAAKERENDSDEHRAHARQWGEPFGEWDEPEEEAAEPTLSGESERIGTQNFDDDTPFGDRVAIV